LYKYIRYGTFLFNVVLIKTGNWGSRDVTGALSGGERPVHEYLRDRTTPERGERAHTDQKIIIAAVTNYFITVYPETKTESIFLSTSYG
jgi:hypothetical protein